MVFDMSEVNALAEELVQSDAKVREEGKRVVKRGAMNVKRESRKRIRESVGASFSSGSGGLTRRTGSGKGHPKWYPASIDFDLDDNGLAAEIGPKLGKKQAFLGKILEYGTATSPPHPHMNPAADEEEPRMQDAVARMVKRALS